MNNSIIKKCLDELQKDTFRKDYVIGMLETLYELSSNKLKETSMPLYPGMSGSLSIPNNNIESTYVKTDEEEIPEYLKPGNIGRIS